MLLFLQVSVDRVLKTLKENANKAKSLLLTTIPQIGSMEWSETLNSLKVSIPSHLHANTTFTSSAGSFLLCPSLPWDTPSCVLYQPHCFCKFSFHFLPQQPFVILGSQSCLVMRDHWKQGRGEFDHLLCQILGTFPPCSISLKSHFRRRIALLCTWPVQPRKLFFFPLADPCRVVAAFKAKTDRVVIRWCRGMSAYSSCCILTKSHQ